jgi:isoamylase
MIAAASSILDVGLPHRLGATLHENGVSFAVFSAHAERIELCVFDGEAEQRFALHGPTAGVFHGFLRNASAGLVYGFRAYGPYHPERGHRFNANKLLLDPYAKAIAGQHQWHRSHHGDTKDDNGRIALKAMVTHTPERATRTRPYAASDVTLYEVHVKGFSALLDAVPEALRGTYAGLAHPASIAHLKRLGVTSLSLLPVQYRLDEPALVERGLSNYWGYNTLGFFCAEPRLSTTPNDSNAANAEFRAMVATLHEHGFEVLLDVVYNHTPEGDEQGATLSFRGLDNASWYRLDKHNLARTENFTGCGNTINVHHPRVTQFVLDSLRYWVEVMGVDGFRFDLAPVLGRTAQEFDQYAPFFTALHQDPVLACVRLIAEPWDIGPHGYQVGRFPAQWSEWNDKFRDSVRRYWLSNNTTRGEFAQRFTASSDLFGSPDAKRLPAASINFLSVHDGFTLTDMVSYSTKHNHANGEHNRDGRGDEPCANFGVEGASDDERVAKTRDRVRRALMATLLLAHGTPMLCAGDEIGNTQHGNNNPYCQDNETTWLKWAHVDTSFLDFTASVLAFRKRETLLNHHHWFREHADGLAPTLVWRTAQGTSLSGEKWQSLSELAFACMIEGAALATRRLFIAFNPQPCDTTFALPAQTWHIALDSSLTLALGRVISNEVSVPSRSLVVFHS